MSYMHCPECRLTVHTTTLSRSADNRCPRCLTEMQAAPARLFRREPPEPPAPARDADAA